MRFITLWPLTFYISVIAGKILRNILFGKSPKKSHLNYLSILASYNRTRGIFSQTLQGPGNKTSYLRRNSSKRRRNPTPFGLEDLYRTHITSFSTSSRHVVCKLNVLILKVYATSHLGLNLKWLTGCILSIISVCTSNPFLHPAMFGGNQLNINYCLIR